MASIPSPEGAPQFKFNDAHDGVGTVTGVAKLDTYLVQYKDKEGRDTVRIAFRVPGTNSTFLLNERISGQHVATSAYEWFTKALQDKLSSSKLEEQKGESVGSV